MFGCPKTTKAIARELGEDPDALLAMAGKVSSDLQNIICKRPQFFAQLIRELKDMPDHAVPGLVHSVLSNPVYAGAYAYGKSRCERCVDETGRVRKRTRLLPMGQWPVLIRAHHPGFIDWATFEMNQARLACNCHPGPEQAGGVAREGSALLQWLATCGRCGRRLRVYYQGKNSTPGYYCANSQAFNGRGIWCMRVGGVRVDHAVVEVFLEAISPAGLEAAIAAQGLGEAQNQSALRQFRLQVERARYETERTERRYRAVEPENRLVARTLETEWENKLHDQSAAEAELARKEQEQRLVLTAAQREQTGYVTMPEAMRILGVSRQTIMQRVKRGELSAVHVSRGKQKGLRIRVLDNQSQLFPRPSTDSV